MSLFIGTHIFFSCVDLWEKREEIQRRLFQDLQSMMLLSIEGTGESSTVCDLKSFWVGSVSFPGVRCGGSWTCVTQPTSPQSAKLPLLRLSLPAAISCMKTWEVETATNLTLKPSKVKQDTEVITSQAVLFILIKNTEKDKFPRCHRRVVQDLGPVCTETQSHAHEELHQSSVQDAEAVMYNSAALQIPIQYGIYEQKQHSGAYWIYWVQHLLYSLNSPVLYGTPSNNFISALTY